jgi:hypothetical protein
MAANRLWGTETGTPAAKSFILSPNPEPRDRAGFLRKSVTLSHKKNPKTRIISGPGTHAAVLSFPGAAQAMARWGIENHDLHQRKRYEKQ